MAKSHQRVSRVLGYQPIRIGAGLKRTIWSSILAIPCALTATGISDSEAVSDTFRSSVHPDAQIPLQRGNCNSIGGFMTSLCNPGISQPCCDKSDDENSKYNAFSHWKPFYNWCSWRKIAISLIDPEAHGLVPKTSVFGTLEIGVSGLVQSVDCGCLSKGVSGTPVPRVNPLTGF